VILGRSPGRCTGSDGALDEAVRVIGEDLDPAARDARVLRSRLAWISGIPLVDEERGTVDLKAGHAAEVPEFRSPRTWVRIRRFLRG
jgi:hypothetical protein